MEAEGRRPGPGPGPGPERPGPSQKRVWSRCETGRRYVMRTPLFSGLPSSILKKTDPTRTPDPPPGPEPGLSLSPPSWSVDPGSPLGVSDLRSTLRPEEPRPRPGSLYPGVRSARQNLSSSVLEVQRPAPPPRPLLTSTVLNPTYTPRSSRSGPTRFRGSDTGLGPYQASYWACAIPEAPPPHPDRKSASWDPDQEYEDLLDYTYPLRPGPGVYKRVRENLLLQTDPNMQDSGIELDLSPGPRSPDLQGSSRPSAGPDSGPEPRSDSPGPRSGSWSSRTFIRSTSLLPRSRTRSTDLDEEFRPLPDHLEELQLLSRQVRDVTVQLNRTGTTSRDSLEPGPVSITQKEEEQLRPGQTAADLRDSGTRMSPGSWVDPVGGGLSQSNLREVEVLVQRLCGVNLRSNRDQNQDQDQDQDQDYSLMQHIQVFGSHLDQLIQQMSSVSEKMRRLAPPPSDPGAVRWSLQSGGSPAGPRR